MSLGALPSMHLLKKHRKDPAWTNSRSIPAISELGKLRTFPQGRVNNPAPDFKPLSDSHIVCVIA